MRSFVFDVVYMNGYELLASGALGIPGALADRRMIVLSSRVMKTST